MGVYDNGTIFGIRMYNFNEDDFANILFEKTYNEIMSDEEKKKAYLFYTNLHDKNKIFFKIYTGCISTLSYNRDNFMMWSPLHLDAFLEKFDV